MGSFGTGFLSAMGDAAQKKTDEIHAEEKSQKDNQAKFYWDAINNAAKGGTLTSDQLHYGIDQAAKAYGNNKEIKGAFGRAKEVISKAMGHPEWVGGTHESQQQGKDGSSGSVPAQPQGGGTAPQQDAAPKAQESPAPATPSAQDYKTSLSQGGVLPAPPAVVQPEIKPLAAPSFPAVLPPPPGTLPPMAAQTTAPVDPQQAFIDAAYPSQKQQLASTLQNAKDAGATDSELKQIRDQFFNVKATPAWKLYKLPDGTQQYGDANNPPPGATAVPAGANVKPTEGHVVSAGDAQLLADQGYVFHSDPDGGTGGAPINVANLPPGSELEPVYKGGSEYFRVSSQIGRTVDVGPTRYGEGNLDVAKGLGGAVPMGPRLPDRITNRGIITGTGIIRSVPTTTTYGGASNATSAPATPLLHPPPSANLATHSHVATAPPALEATPPVDQTNKFDFGKPPDMVLTNKLPAGTANTISTKLSPVKTAIGQILGSDATGRPSLASYAYLMDDPENRRLLINATNAALTSVPPPDPGSGLEGLASWTTNMPNAIQNAQSQNVQDAVNALSRKDPALQEFFMRQFPFRAAAIGFRSATGAPSTESSVGTIGNEIALRNVNSSRAYLQQLIGPLGEAADNLSGSAGVNPEYIKYLDGAVKTMQEEANRGGKKLTPPPVKGNSTSPLSSKGTVSLKDAMALPENKGKTKEQVSNHISSLGYLVGP